MREGRQAGRKEGRKAGRKGTGVGGRGGVRVESPAVERTILSIDLDRTYNVATSQERCERRRAAAFVSRKMYLEPNIMAGRTHCVL